MTNSRRLSIEHALVLSQGFLCCVLAHFNPYQVTELRSGRLEFRFSTMYSAAFLEIVSKSLVSERPVLPSPFCSDNGLHSGWQAHSGWALEPGEIEETGQEGPAVV